MARDAVFDIIANDKASKGFNSAGNSAESFAGKLGHVVGSIAKYTAIAAGAAAAGGLVAVFKTGIDEQKDFLAGQAQLAAGIKSTGGAANVTVDHLEDLASSIQNYSGQTDDSIVAAEKLLLTFTNIQNQAGKNNDIFDQTVKVSADMAARMGTDASASAIQLGKALNDPVKGITALTRVGVSFTEGQKDQIKALVKSGKTLDAQKIILKELNTEFGGSAKAFGDTLPGQLARAKRSFEDVSQSLIQAMMPVLVRLGDILVKYVIPGFKTVVDWVIANWPRIQKTIVDGFQKYIVPYVMFFVGIWRKYLIPAFSAAVEYVVKHWPQIQKAIAAVVAFVVKNWPNILKAIQFVWDGIKPVLKALGNLFLTLWHSIIEPLIGWVKAHWTEISTALKIGVAIIAVAFKVLSVALTVAINVAAAVIRTAVPIIVGIIQGIVAVVQFVIDAVQLYVAVWTTTFDVVMAVVTTARDWIVNAFNAVVDFFQKLPGRIASVASGMWDSVKGAATAAKTWVVDRFNDIVSFITGMPGKIASAASGMWDGIKDAFRSAINWIIDGWNRLSIPIPRFDTGVPGVPTFGGGQIDFPDIQRFSKGALTNGPTLAWMGDNQTGRELAVPLDSSGGNEALTKAVAVAVRDALSGGPGEFYLDIAGVRVLARRLREVGAGSAERRGGR